MARYYESKNKDFKEILRTIKRTTLEAMGIMPVKFPLIVILTIIVSLIGFAFSYIFAKIIDELIKLTTGGASEFNHALITLLIAYLTLSLVEVVINTLTSYWQKESYYKLNDYFTLQFLKKASDLDLYHYENPTQNDLIKKAKDSYSWRPPGFIEKIIWILPDIIKVLVSVSIIAIYSPVFFVIISISVVPALYVSIKTSKTVWNIWETKTEVRRTFDHASSYLSSEGSLAELRIFKTKDYLFGIVNDLFKNFLGAEKKANQRKTILETLSSSIVRASIFAFWIYGFKQVLDGNLTVGLLSFYIGAASKYSESLGNFFKNISRIYDDAQYMADYYKFIDLKNTIISGSQKIEDSKKAPLIEFKNVSFAYPGTNKLVLKNFNLVLDPGEKIALVGENGSGKSTIIKLLCRFYDVTSGEILIDNVNIKDIDLEDWYSLIGVLFQSFVQYNFLPAQKSIGLGDVSKVDDLAEIIKSAKKSGADKFIEELKNKYENVLSKHFPEGVDLSGGQWQRIALARAFFRDAPILILDEPTSAIDAKGEFEIFEKLYEFSSGKTVIIISHRFSTVRKADKIFVIDEGKIVESGTHQELMKISGKYKSAFEVQAEGYK